MKAAANKTAKETFRENARDAEALLDFLGMEIRARAEEYEREGLHWGHAGSMGHWREKLIETLVSVMGAYDESDCRRMIEDALEDTKA